MKLIFVRIVRYCSEIIESGFVIVIKFLFLWQPIVFFYLKPIVSPLNSNSVLLIFLFFTFLLFMTETLPKTWIPNNISISRSDLIESSNESIKMIKPIPAIIPKIKAAIIYLVLIAFVNRRGVNL